MKTVKEVSEIAGISIRTLRYYDEIGLLKPTDVTDSGYRLYDNHAMEKLQEIMFFRELEIPLKDIRDMMNNPDYDKKQALAGQKRMLETKRNRLNGIIELITDVMEGVNTMNFEAFNENDAHIMINQMIADKTEEEIAELLKLLELSSIEEWQAQLAENLKKDEIGGELLRWYGDKEKVVESAGPLPVALETVQEKSDLINRQFARAMKTGDADLAHDAVAKLADFHKETFRLDNARAMLLSLAKECLENESYGKATDELYGAGVTRYTAEAIYRYYGV